MPVTQQYRTAAVARALGLGTPRQLTSLLERRLVPIGNPGSGVARTFSLDTIVRLALIRKLMDFGIHASRAADIATARYRDSGLLIIDGQHVSNAAREGCDLPSAALVLDLDSMRAEIDQRLAA